ncbi:protein-glutamate O-methyltransferase CheR [bacterium]|nr:protein-glutamate O-methyltransferase CheR [bacterium]
MELVVFEKFQSLIRKESGISLKEEKKALLENRIRKRLRELSLKSPEEYLEVIELDVDGSELVHLLDAISTNHTFFFRENEHFVFFRDLLTGWKGDGISQVRIWCAASSTGEEPYTILMSADEVLDLSRFDFRLLASDICIPALQHASAGIYEESRMTGINDEQKERYFAPAHDSHSSLQVMPSLREHVLFKRLNLNVFPYPLKGGLDIIFCRNVMIYFDRDLRERVVSEFHRLLKPGGYLFVGHSEASAGQVEGFQRVSPAIFRKDGGLV